MDFLLAILEIQYFNHFSVFIENLKEIIEKSKEEQIELSRKIKDIEANLADAKGYRERQLKEAKENMQRLKTKSDKSRKEWQQREQV